jgi:hypothetical protein
MRDTVLTFKSVSTRKIYLLALGVLNGDSRVHPHFPDNKKRASQKTPKSSKTESPIHGNGSNKNLSSV